MWRGVTAHLNMAGREARKWVGGGYLFCDEHHGLQSERIIPIHTKDIITISMSWV